MPTMTLEYACNACRGSGVFRGMGEPPGYGVICWDCKGSGKRVFEYTPFTERVHRDDIKRIGHSGGSIRNTRTDPEQEGIPYEDWLAGKEPPPRPS